MASWALRRIARHPWFDFAVMFAPWYKKALGDKGTQDLHGLRLPITKAYPPGN